MRKSIVLTLLLVVWLSACVRSVSTPQPQPTFPVPATLAPTSTPAVDSAVELARVEQSVQQAIDLERGSVLAFITSRTSIENIDISSDGLWAVGWLIPIDPDTGEPAPIEPGLVLMQKMVADWQVWLPTTNGWIDVLPNIPDEILSPEHKAQWNRRVTFFDAAIPATLGGYLLPWEAGVTRRLTQSTCHDEYIPSGNAHFSFDFSTRGELWEIYASRGGQVWLWKDDVPTCMELTCSDTQPLGNYIVIKDESTDPVTYQLYLHLAQYSIPDELKVKGLLIPQGRFLGIVDNTGQSWGHHLHFQVQVPLYGENYYWGRAVDITFDDVNINGGRPRVQNGWCNDASYCNRPDDVCNDFQENYTSQNEIQTNEPLNIYFPLIFNHEPP
jgi:hypothetical protein